MSNTTWNSTIFFKTPYRIYSVLTLICQNFPGKSRKDQTLELLSKSKRSRTEKLGQDDANMRPPASPTSFTPPVLPRKDPVVPVKVSSIPSKSLLVMKPAVEYQNASVSSQHSSLTTRSLSEEQRCILRSQNLLHATPTATNFHDGGALFLLQSDIGSGSNFSAPSSFSLRTELDPSISDLSAQAKPQHQLEYLNFTARFPELISSDKVKLKTEIQLVLGYDKFKDTKVCDLNFSGCKSGMPVLDDFSIGCGVSLK